MALCKDQERLCREMGDPKGVAISLADQANLLGQMGRPGEALPLVEEAHRLATEHGYAALAEHIKVILVSLRDPHEEKMIKEKEGPKVTFSASGNPICPVCKLESSKGAGFCKWCKAPL